MVFKPGVIEPRNMSVNQRRIFIAKNFTIPRFLLLELRAQDTDLKQLFSRTLAGMIKGKEDVDFEKLEELKHRVQMERLSV